MVNEPTKEETLDIITRKKKVYEDYHSVEVSNEILNDIVGEE